MCIIAAKPAGVEMPATETIRTMWANNPDGAGFMWADGKTVHIRKGFMALEDLERSIFETARAVDLTAAPVVLHLRIRTHGKVAPECCHPFPVASSMGALKKLETRAPLGVAHNGIIPGADPAPGVSDTMQFIADFLAPLTKGAPTWYKSPGVRRAVEAAASSRLTILSGAGDLVTLGTGWTDRDGVQYSNGSYKPSAWTAWDRGLDRWGLDPDRYAELMWLPPDACVYIKGGPLEDDPEWFLVDDAGLLYEYDAELDAVTPVDGIAYNSSGTFMRFNPCGDVEWLPVLE